MLVVVLHNIIHSRDTRPRSLKYLNFLRITNQALKIVRTICGWQTSQLQHNIVAFTERRTKKFKHLNVLAVSNFNEVKSDQPLHRYFVYPLILNFIYFKTTYFYKFTIEKFCRYFILFIYFDREYFLQ